MDFAPTVTATTSGFNLFPWHISHKRSIIYCSISSLAYSESVSWYLRSSQGITPSHLASSEAGEARPLLRAANPLSPCKTRLMTLGESSSTGVFKENFLSFARSSSFHQKNPWRPILWEACAQGKMAPSARESRGLGITSLGSTSSFSPNPWHAGHAPKGELKENILGSISGREILHCSQAKRSLKTRSSPDF